MERLRDHIRNMTEKYFSLTEEKLMSYERRTRVNEEIEKLNRRESQEWEGSMANADPQLQGRNDVAEVCDNEEWEE